MSYIKQDESGGGGDISGSGANTQVAVFNGAKSITSAGTFTANLTNGRVTAAGYNMNTGSAGSPALAISGDADTGVFSAGANQIGFAVAGSDALGVGANKNVTVGGASGTAGQVLTSGGSGGATTWTTVSGGSSFAGTAQVWRSSTNVRNNITGLAPYSQGSDTSSNFATSLERVFFFPFIAPETVAITKLSVYVSSANASSPPIHVGIYTGTDHTATNILQRIPDALQMEAEVATATGGYNDGTVSAASGGSTTITQGTLYYIAYAPKASASGYSSLQAFNGRVAPIGVSTGNAIQSVIQYTPYSYGDGLALSYPTTYQASASITGAAVTNVFYRVD